jgi:Tol biopolymer transport system component
MLVQSDAGARFAFPAYLLFLKERALMAQPFDALKLQLSGEPSLIAEEISYNEQNGRSFFCASDNGVLVYRTGIRSLSRLAWVDRSGKELGSLGQVDELFSPALSRDEKKVAMIRADQSSGSDIWLLDIARQSSSRLTFDPALDSNPVWSPDGSRIVFSSNRLGPYDLYWKQSSGAGNEEVLLKSEPAKFVTDWSSDGRFILYMEASGITGGADLWVLSVSEDQKRIPIVKSTFDESQAKFSPDTHWIAYVSNESGIPQVYVQKFPPGDGKWMVSINGGRQPQWRYDGKELFYYGLDGKLMAVAVKTDGNNFEAGTPNGLFAARFVVGQPTFGASYSVTRDGRFLVNLPEELPATPAVIVQNWTATLKK